MSRSSRVNQEITALLRARAALLWIASSEETRVEAALMNALPNAMRIRFWDAVSGLTEYVPLFPNAPKDSEDAKKFKVVTLSFTPASYGDPAKLSEQGGQPCDDPLLMLRAIREVPQRCLYVLRDINAFKDPITLRSLRNTATTVGSTPSAEQRSMVILTPSAEIPQDLLGQAQLLSYPLPDREDVTAIFDSLKFQEGVEKPSASTREQAIEAALGLSAAEVQACFNRSIVTRRAIDPRVIVSEKKRVITRDKTLTWIDPDPRGLSAIGGLGVLKDWLSKRKGAFSEAARAYGLKAPKGMLLAGLPGGGKSLTAKCVSTAWNMPLLKLDLGGQKSKYVGDSEANIRKALATAEACAPCVLWIDEIEKALKSGGEDGGVSADQIGTILSWMQDREAPVFVVATANDVRSLPPELLRKGRFDQLFWCDLPTSAERSEILQVSLRSAGKGESVDIQALTKMTEGWVGAEIASIVPEAMFAAFSDSARDITTEDLLQAARSVVPLSTTMGAKLKEVRDFMAGKALNASYPEVAVQTETSGDLLDID